MGKRRKRAKMAKYAKKYASMRSTFSVSKVDISFTRSVSDWLLIVSNGASKID